MIKKVRGLSGLGDALYIYPVVKELSKTLRLSVSTDFPEIFSLLPVKTENFYRAQEVDYNLSYLPYKESLQRTQYQDICYLADLYPEYSLDVYPVESHATEAIRRLKRGGKKVCAVKAPAYPMGSKNSEVLLPDTAIFQIIINAFKDSLIFVSLGKNIDFENYENVYSLVDKTSILEYIKCVSLCDYVLTCPGNMLAIAEGYKIPSLTIFTKRGLESDVPFFSSIKPEKVIEYPEISKHSLDDAVLATNIFKDMIHD